MAKRSFSMGMIRRGASRATEQAESEATQQWASLSETSLAEHRAPSRKLTESEYDVHSADIGAEALEMANAAAGIPVLPHLIGQHVNREVVVGVQLLRTATDRRVVNTVVGVGVVVVGVWLWLR